MSTMANRAHGAKYIYQDDTSASVTYEFGFMQVRLVSNVYTQPSQKQPRVTAACHRDPAALSRRRKGAKSFKIFMPSGSKIASKSCLRTHR